MSEHDHETPGEGTEGQAVVDGPSPVDGGQELGPDPEFDPTGVPDDDEDQAEDAPAPHDASKGYGVTGKFSTTNRNDL